MSVYQDEQTKLFIPSSTDLRDMIKAAEAKVDADMEQCRLREEAREDARRLRAQVNQDKAIAQRQRWGAIDSRGRVVY